MPENLAAEANPQREPSAPEPQTDFRSRMRQRLAAERNSPEPAGPPEGYEDGEANRSESTSDAVGEGYEEALDPARQADEEASPEPEELTGEEAESEDAVTETSEDDTETEVTMTEVEALREEARKAEEARRNMERDYRIKTHKIAAAIRDVEQQGTVVKQQAQFFANLAEQSLQQFNGVNWDALKSDPAKYQQTKAAFEAAIGQRDMLKRALGQIGEQHTQLLEQAKDREAEVSRDILKTTLPDWSNELYGKLRSFAMEELAYTAEEFDDMTDWRRIRDIHAQYQIANASKRVAKLPRKQGKQPVNRQRERQIQSQRDAKGRFQNSRQRLFDQPGDREARRNFFQDKLRAEREGRR